MKWFYWNGKCTFLGFVILNVFEIFNFIPFFSLEIKKKVIDRCSFCFFVWYWCGRHAKYFVNVVVSKFSFCQID